MGSPIFIVKRDFNLCEKLYTIEDPLFTGKDEANDADSEQRLRLAIFQFHGREISVNTIDPHSKTA